MSFKSIFIACVFAVALIAGALIINNHRPQTDIAEPGASLVRASGKCAECHRNETSAIVHQFEGSRHALKGVNCLDCHQALDGQQKVKHRGFVISDTVTSKSCKQCHETEYKQFSRSRHSAPAWGAVRGNLDFTPEQIAYAEKYHPGTTTRKANGLAKLEGDAARIVGCQSCHDIGKPNSDGSIGKCTECHGRHGTSVALARNPQTCGQCHLGPDHSQIEIYTESKHGALFASQQAHMNLNARPKELTTKDMPVPTCATCHMSGLEGMKVTHDVSERLGWWLFAPVSKKRPDYRMAQNQMKEICTKCHASESVDDFYIKAESVVLNTNKMVKSVKDLMDSAKAEGLLTPAPFDQPIDFMNFDYWHYFGRTAKHGAFMGGADYVQWHGNYELLLKKAELKEKVKAMRMEKKK